MRKKIFLTFDMDWVCDEVIYFCNSLMKELDVYGTLNVTHATDILDELRYEKRFELGIHPNFNPLLNSQDSGKNAKERIQELKSIVPEAVTVRSHSLVSSSYLSIAFAEAGLLYESNIFFEPYNEMKIGCFKDVYGMIKVPLIFEDDIYLANHNKKEIKWYLSDSFEAPRVFNFHPIHLFLNTENMCRYEDAKLYVKNYTKLKSYRNMFGNGITDYFKILIEEAKNAGYTFEMIGRNNDESCSIRKNTDFI